MLTIRALQCDALAVEQEMNYVDCLCNLLAARYPSTFAAMERESVTARLMTGLQRAKSYGLNGALELGRYLELVFLMGNFESSPWASEVLERIDEIGPTEVSRLLLERGMLRSEHLD
ncbi:MAG: hypothetical protein AAGF11_32335 [Myxococcota bacterium]